MFTIGLNTTLNMYESYALLECLTPGQEIMLRLTGPYNFIIGSQNTDEVLEEARNAIVENLDINEKVPVWDGVNLDIFEQEVGLTNEAQRSIAAGKQYDVFAKDVDTLAQKYRDIASVVSSSFTISSGAILVTKCAMIIAPKFFSFISCYSIAGAISSFASAAIVSAIMTVTGVIFTVASIVCSIFITFFLEDIIAWILTEEYDRTTFIGYKLTANANDAVRDIRLLYNCNSSSVTFGDLNYGAMGTIGNFSLMVSSTNSNPAPPVLHLAVYEKNVLPDSSLGYEPVNEFSGGMAHPLGRTDYRLYFMPETTFTTGPDYLAGIKSDVYHYNTFTSNTGDRHPIEYNDETDMFENSVDSYRAYKAQNYGEQFLDFDSQTHFYFAGRNSSGSNNYVNLAYKYTTTKNPYSETSSYAQGHSRGTWTASVDGNHSASCTVCGESEASPHIFVEYIPNNDATKDADGTKTATCVVCEATDTVTDEGSKLVDTPDDSDDGCSHMCHNTGVSGIFRKIIRIFRKLFRLNPVCECGAAHY